MRSRLTTVREASRTWMVTMCELPQRTLAACRCSTNMPPALAELAVSRLRALTGTPAAGLATAGVALVVLGLACAGAWATARAHDGIAAVRAQEASVARYDALQRAIVTERTALPAEGLPAARHAPGVSGPARAEVQRTLQALRD